MYKNNSLNSSENELALPYLEKALEYNPNSSDVINTLSDFYATKIPNTAKYLEYALKGIQLDIAANDSIDASYVYLHIANAFIQSGFENEAEKYINQALEYNPSNIYAAYVKPYITYTKNKNLKLLNERLTEVFFMDTTRLDVVQEIGKTYYFMRDYESAFKWYQPFTEIKKAYDLDMYNEENGKIAVVYEKMGLIDESDELLEGFKVYAENNTLIYKHLNLAAYYSWKDNKEKALGHFKLFSQEDNFHYWIVIFMEIDPLMDNIKDLPEFKKIFNDIKTKFWDYHKNVKLSLSANCLHLQEPTNI